MKHSETTKYNNISYSKWKWRRKITVTCCVRNNMLTSQSCHKRWPKFNRTLSIYMTLLEIRTCWGVLRIIYFLRHNFKDFVYRYLFLNDWIDVNIRNISITFVIYTNIMITSSTIFSDLLYIELLRTLYFLFDVSCCFNRKQNNCHRIKCSCQIVKVFYTCLHAFP